MEKRGFKMDIFIIKTLQGLKPADQESEENYKKLKLNETYKVKLTKPRNYKFHKKYFALINLCYENLNEQFIQEYKIDCIEDLRHLIMIEQKRYTLKKTYSNRLYPVIDSISFSKMDNFEFEELYKQTIQTVSKILCTESREIEQELINFM